MSASYPNHQLSSKKAEMALAMLLTSCTEQRLAGFTAEGLSRSYNVPVARAEAMLAKVRNGRGQ